MLSVLITLAFILYSHSGKATSNRTALYLDDLDSYPDVPNVEPANATLGVSKCRKIHFFTHLVLTFNPTVWRHSRSLP